MGRENFSLNFWASLNPVFSPALQRILLPLVIEQRHSDASSACQMQSFDQMSRLMGKPTICKGENKDQISFAVSAFVFATRIVQFLFYLNPKFQGPSSFLCLYRPVCVEPVRKPHCWFSHEVAQIMALCEFHSAVIW